MRAVGTWKRETGQIIRMHSGTLLEVALLYFIGLVLIVAALNAPHAGSEQGKSLFEVAHTSTWSQLGDWAAAWCSLKIMTIGVGALLIAIGLVVLLMLLGRRGAALGVFLAGALVATLGFGTGLFYLLKAVL